MDPRRALGFSFLLFLLISFSTFTFATPMKPDVGAMLQRAAEPETHYPVARVGWNGPETEAKPFNPVYESMMYTVSAEALRNRFLRIAVPPIGVWLSVFAIVFLLRMMRRERERTAVKPSNVIVMPVRDARASEAA